MHGSYNWSKVAQYNDETLATALDRDFVKKFADEFMRLYNNHNEQFAKSFNCINGWDQASKFATDLEVFFCPFARKGNSKT